MEPRVIVMGVSGAGKSLLGAALAARLGVSFLDGDDLHPAANIAKMRAGLPLTDADRAPWLAAIGEALASGRGMVVACSALKHRYRDQLRASAGAGLRFVFLDGTPDLLSRRLRERSGHFMTAVLLDSQLATLERPSPEEALTLDADRPLAELVAAAAEYCTASQAFY